ncbi:hypothetical protein [Kitasatospora sp. NPDC097691]|uniref:hypothetical protein n=1 Tax=Kitasatospora sp. NPDC097691 TaxID=3157231 RepID=UPI0033343956
MKLGLRRHRAALTTATGLALAAVASCSGAPPAGPGATATIPPSAVRLLLAQEVAAGLERIRAATDNPPGEQWGHYRDEGGTIWYFWPLPDGRFCHGKEFRIDEQDIREVGCTSAPLPDDGTPAVQALHGPASVDGGRWVSFLYADQEEVQDVACGDRHFAVRTVARFPGAHGPRTVYAVSTPWAALGVLRALVRHADGTVVPDRAQFPDGKASAHVSGERVCE